ncbi:hypothetical protein D9M68_839630 [compost metagenome]
MAPAPAPAGSAYWPGGTAAYGHPSWPWRRHRRRWCRLRRGGCRPPSARPAAPTGALPAGGPPRRPRRRPETARSGASAGSGTPCCVPAAARLQRASRARRGRAWHSPGHTGTGKAGASAGAPPMRTSTTQTSLYLAKAAAYCALRSSISSHPSPERTASWFWGKRIREAVSVSCFLKIVSTLPGRPQARKP